jgi:hypothetical protein
VEMPASKRTRQRKAPAEPSVVRALADELGVTTPKKIGRRHKGPTWVAIYKDLKR